MKREQWIAFGMIIGFILFWLINTLAEPIEQTYPIVDKYEDNGKCYIAIEREITPDEYIGYDVGDEYAGGAE